MKRIKKSGFSLLSILALCTGVAADEPVFDEAGPFRIGEGFGTPVTCETLADWVERVPDYDGRITMVINGEIVESHWDGALAYLIMCEPEEIQVMCVTYQPQKVTGKTIMFAGGYSRNGQRQVTLDPCLVYPAGDS